MADNRFDLELGLDFSKVTEALQQIKSQFTGTSAEFQKIANKFKDSFNTMTNAIKLYGMESSQANTATKSMERAMVELTKNGIDPASIGFQQLSSQIGPLASKMKGAGDSVKKSNMQYTNLALVLQDLPYGFRGIQNNLPALIGGMAGVTGGVYLAASALIAFFTAWDNGMIKFGNSVKLATDYSKEAATAYANETVKLESLYRVAIDSNRTMVDRLEAAKELKREYPGLLDAYSEEDIALGKAKTAYKELTTTIWEYALAQAATKALEEIATKKLNLMIQKTKLLAKERKLAAIEDAQGTLQGINVYSQYSSQLANVRQEIKKNTQEQKNLVKAASDYLPIIDATVTAEAKLNEFKDEGKKGGKQKDTYTLDRLKAQQQAYKDDIYKFRAYGILIINEEEKLAIARAKADGTYLQNKKEITDRYQADRLTNDNLFEANLNKVLDENAKIRTAQEKKELEIQIANRLDIAKAILAINKQFAEDDLRNAILFAKNQTKIIETELAVQDKLNRNNLTNRIQFTEEALAKLVALAAFTFDPKVLAVYLDSFDKVNAKLKGMGTTWEATSNKIKGLIEGVMSDSISKFAENIGKSFNGEDVDIFGGITEIIATGLQNIGKALIAYGTAMDAFKLAFTNPFAAIAAGIVLVATGAALQGSIKKMNDSGSKTKKFANGGIISGPTMGLMGEYPGARTNPEVVAPLDKLKDMIGGGGGGTFMLRGQDLLLSVNRAQKASNLKGQNISLA